MELEQKGFRIAQAPGRGEVGAIAGGPQTPQQSGLGPTLERRVQGQRPATLELLAEAAPGEQQVASEPGVRLAEVWQPLAEAGEVEGGEAMG